MDAEVIFREGAATAAPAATCPSCHRELGQFDRLTLEYVPGQNWWVFHHYTLVEVHRSGQRDIPVELVTRHPYCGRAVPALTGTSANHTIPVEPAPDWTNDEFSVRV